MSVIRVILLTSVLLLAAVAADPARAAAPKDLDACQSAVADAGAKHTAGVMQAVRNCLKPMTKSVLGGATTAAAATASRNACRTAFRKLENSADPTKTLGGAFDATVDAKCDPAVNPSLAHDDADTVAIGAGTLGAGSLASLCGKVGGDGNVTSFADWRDCVRRAGECQARQAIAVVWPRALEMFAALKTALEAEPATSERDDALAALTAFDAALEGGVDDDSPEVSCGVTPGGAPAGLLVTGQTFCNRSNNDGSCPGYSGGDDGFFRAGTPFDYTDNGDGTITDEVTGLTWEKLDRAGGVHDVDFADTWNDASAKVAQLNDATFAGHADWRVPSRDELRTLLSFIGGASPQVQPELNDACTPGCSFATCSCAGSGAYWTSSSYAPDASLRWTVSFADGTSSPEDPTTVSGRVRAVRGEMR